MALPIRDFVLSTAVEGALNKARVLRDNVAAWKAMVDAGGVDANIVLNAMHGIKAGRDVLSQYAAVSGLDAHARDEYNDPTLNFTAELNGIITACNACLNWVAANFPKDASGYLLKDKIVNGELQPRTFSAAALAAFSAELQTLLNAFA